MRQPELNILVAATGRARFICGQSFSRTQQRDLLQITTDKKLTHTQPLQFSRRLAPDVGIFVRERPPKMLFRTGLIAL